MQTGGTAAQYWIGTAEVKGGSHILLGRRTHNALDTRIHKLLGRGNNILINRMSHMLLSRGRRTQIWHTGINAIRMDISEVVAKLEVLGEPAPCLGEEV